MKPNKKQPKDNPILSMAKLIVFPKFGEIKINRDKKFGGNLIFKNYSELEKNFESGKLHPADLKNSISEYLEKLISPIRSKWK